MRYWWVNHKKTARQEIDGKYLWSPVREANGARSQFYDNMRIAEPGDAVLSFSDGLIRNVGIVRDFASPAPKPESFGMKGEYWSSEGWLLPIEWELLVPPVRPKERIGEFAALLPKKYSPIHPFSGNGNQKAYLAEVGKEVFDLLTDFRKSLPSYSDLDINSALTRVDNAIEAVILHDPGLDFTTKEQLTLARKGQGLFRSRTLAYGKACRLTNIETPRLLIASHIKPWRSCTTATERLDGANGLLLTPHVDRLFDRGLISFGDDGKVLMSSKLDRLDLERLGLLQACARGCASFHEDQHTYLAYHRERVFLL